MKRVVIPAWIALWAAVVLVGSASANDVYRTPFIPSPLPEPTAGSVVVSFSVFDGTSWKTDQTLVIADPRIDFDCGTSAPANAS